MILEASSLLLAAAVVVWAWVDDDTDVCAAADSNADDEGDVDRGDISATNPPIIL